MSKEIENFIDKVNNAGNFPNGFTIVTQGDNTEQIIKGIKVVSFPLVQEGNMYALDSIEFEKARELMTTPIMMKTDE